MSQAWAGPGWVVKGTGRSAYAEAASQDPGSHLRLACEDTVTLYLYPPRGWRGAKLDDVTLILDGERIVVSADGVDRGVVLSDLPSGTVGTTKALRARMIRSRSLVIAGAATGAISRGKLTFGLEDAAGAITEFERRCPAARDAASAARPA
jgi:hypothetical protein